MSKRINKSPIGTTLTCKNWISEAAYRMIQNNLDPEVAERPEDLIVYGGLGKQPETGKVLIKYWNASSSLMKMKPLWCKVVNP